MMPPTSVDFIQAIRIAGSRGWWLKSSIWQRPMGPLSDTQDTQFGGIEIKV